MNQLKDFFNAERKRVFEPDPFFAKRVMARLNAGAARQYGIWDIVPGSTRPVLATALVMILALLINSNVVQVGQANSLKNNALNQRVLYSEYSHRRGPRNTASTRAAPRSNVR